MAETQVEVGGVYRAKVGGKPVEVRIEREIWKGDKHTGWGGINLATNRPTTLKAGLKLKRVPEPPAAEAAAPDAAVTAPPKRAPKQKSGAGPVPSTGKRRGKASRVPADKPKSKTEPKEKPKRRGALDQAAEILAESRQPMTTAAMVAVMLERKLWSTKGKTPAATLYSAIVREIAAKGGKARFVKHARGLFVANRKGT